MTRGFVLRLASPGSQSTLETFDPPPCVVSLTFLDNVVRGLVVPPPFFYPTPPPCAGCPGLVCYHPLFLLNSQGESLRWSLETDPRSQRNA